MRSGEIAHLGLDGVGALETHHEEVVLAAHAEPLLEAVPRLMGDRGEIVGRSWGVDGSRGCSLPQMMGDDGR